MVLWFPPHTSPCVAIMKPTYTYPQSFRGKFNCNGVQKVLDYHLLEKISEGGEASVHLYVFWPHAPFLSLSIAGRASFSMKLQQIFYKSAIYFELASLFMDSSLFASVWTDPPPSASLSSALQRPDWSQPRRLWSGYGYCSEDIQCCWNR